MQILSGDRGIIKWNKFFKYGIIDHIRQIINTHEMITLENCNSGKISNELPA